MTISLYVFVIACCVFVAACLACLALGYHWGRDDGYAAAELERSEARAERRKATRGKHAAARPRTSLVQPGVWAEAETEYRRRIDNREPVVRAPWRHPIGPGYRATTAADIAPVVLPEPGTYLPGPRRSTSPNTVTFPKVQLDTASTGEIRAIGDEMVAAIEAAGEAS